MIISFINYRHAAYLDVPCHSGDYWDQKYPVVAKLSKQNSSKETDKKKKKGVGVEDRKSVV